MGDDTYDVYDSLLKNGKIYLYIWIYEPTNGENYLMERNNIVYFSDYGCVRGGYS